MNGWNNIEGTRAAKNGDVFSVENAQFSFKMATKAIKRDDPALAGVEIPEGGKVYPVDMSNTAIDRTEEYFKEEVLQLHSRQISDSGLTFNLFHKSDIPVGRVLKKAEVLQREKGPTLTGFVWVNDKATIPNQPNISVSESIETGMLTDVSVEFKGTIRYVEDDNGKGVFEWFINPKAPEHSEILGLALVPKGAQRGAGIKAKSINGDNKPVKEQLNTVYMYKDKFFVGSKEYAVSAKVEANEVEAKGIEAIITDFKSAVSERDTAKEALAVSETKVATLEAEMKAARLPHIADIENYSRELKETAPTEEAIEAMNYTSLKGCAEALKTKHDASIEPVKEKSVNKNEPVGFLR